MRAPRRADASAASQPAWPPPTTMTSYRSRSESSLPPPVGEVAAAAAVERRGRRGRGRQDGEGRGRVKGAEGRKDERPAAVAGGRRRSSIAGDGEEEDAALSLLCPLSRLWLSLRMEIENGNLQKGPSSYRVIIVSEMPLSVQRAYAEWKLTDYVVVEGSFGELTPLFLQFMIFVHLGQKHLCLIDHLAFPCICFVFTTSAAMTTS